jgi:predicted ATPase
VRLLIDRIRLVQPQFILNEATASAVGQVCSRLDGIPLAIELAAARGAAMAIQEVAARLDDRFHLLTGGSRVSLPRQRTLQATIDWSHKLLTPAERTLFRRLSVFAGGWSLDAAETVCADEPIERSEVLEALTGLVGKSLVLMSEANGAARYGLLETIRHYGQQKLREAGEAARTQHRHAQWFVALVEQAAPHMQSTAEKPWLARLVVELDNLRSALAWCEADGRAASGEMGLRLADGLRDLWRNRGQHTEGRDWTERMLATAGGAPGRLHARILHWSAQFCDVPERQPLRRTASPAGTAIGARAWLRRI